MNVSILNFSLVSMRQSTDFFRDSNIYLLLQTFLIMECTQSRTCAPAIITSREVIIAGYDAILNQSDQQNLYNHLSNYTK